tara:strand:+ start:1271 stop:1510 length:240 start_codon:yes stop_codon:yes gene_type:complete
MSELIARLHHAFRWDCDECGRENFERAISLEKGYLEGKITVDNDEDSDYVLYPAIVVCEHCTAQFLSSFNGELEIEEDE